MGSKIHLPVVSIESIQWH